MANQSSLRVAFIVGQFPVLSETFILNQVTGLLDRGHQVDIYAERWGDRDKVHPDVIKYGLLDRTYLMAAIPENPVLRVLQGIPQFVQHVGRSPRLIFSSLNVVNHGFLAAGLWLFYAALSLMNKPPYDIIHCQFGTQGYRGLFFQRLMQPRPKLIVMFRGHDISRYVQDKGVHAYDDLFQAADYFLANCEFFKQRVIELGCPRDRIAVHLSGLDCSKFQFLPRHLAPNTPIRIATTGRLVEKKGIEYAIRAVAKLLLHYPNLQYQIIGDGPLREQFTDLIHHLGATQNIHLVGWKNEQEIIEILNQSHLFVAPSVTAQDGNQDAPINVLKEAMAMGLPVVSTHHGGIPELVQDGVSGFLVPERDADALAAKLELLIQQPERWADMGRAGKAFVEAHYDIHKLNDRLVQRYEQLLNKSPLAASVKIPAIAAKSI